MSSAAHGCYCIMYSHVARSSRHTLYVSLLAAVLSLLTLSPAPSVGLPTSQFYPFNISKENEGGDTHTNEADDGGSGMINLTVPFPFYNRSDYNKLYVNNNGIISFRSELTAYNPLNFSDPAYTEQNAVIAPYWADIDIENVHAKHLDAAIVYRQIDRRDNNHSHVLERATSDVRTYFGEQQGFSASNVFIVTWYNVGYYGAAAAGKLKRNTFQCVMITDGDQSYVIFNYDSIVWTTGANSGGGPETGLPDEQGQAAVVGFHSGQNGTYFELEDSGVRGIINVAQRSNLPQPIPGKYIFRVDGAAINNLSCPDSNQITITPSTISMLGHEAIRVGGVCLDTRYNVSARIPEIDVTFPCHVTHNRLAVCVPPPLFRTGELTFELSINGDNWTHSAPLTSVNLLDVPAHLTRRNPGNWIVGRMVSVSWDDATSVPAGKTKALELMAYNSLTTELVSVFTKEVKSGETDERFMFKEYSSHSTLVTRLCWQIHSTLRNPVCIWSDVFPVRWKSKYSEESEQWCNVWLSRERTRPRIVLNGPTCPCIQTMAAQAVGDFHLDPSCDSGAEKCIYSPGAVQCYRRNLKSATYNGETCCYDKDGLMDIREHSGAGTHQRYHYKAQEPGTIVPFFSYFEEDLLPRLHCCQYSRGNCSGYISYRNATTCSGYSPPSPAQAAGDPHIVTLDGKNYSFNGLGDFYLVYHDDVFIQVRAVQATDEHGKPQNASVFSRVAVVMPSASDVVEIRKNGSMSDVLVNNRPIHISTSQYPSRNISIMKPDDGSFLIVLEPVSVSVTVEVTPDLLNIIVLIGEESYKDTIRGLLGNYNKDPDDDFIARDGTRLPPDSTMREVHYNFGMTWAVQPNESYLDPVSDVSSTDPLVVVEDFDYQPVFIEEIEADLPDNVVQVCGENLACKFDYTVTGKESIARSTMQFTDKFETMKKELNQKVIRCPYVEFPENGNRTVTGNTNGSVVTYSCDSGYELIPNNPVRVCQENSTWSGANVTCAIKTVNPEGSSNQLVIIVLVVGGSFSLVLIVILVAWVYVRQRRRKPDPSPPSYAMEPVSVFENANFMQSLQTLMKDGRYRIPRPQYVDPSIYVEYF